MSEQNIPELSGPIVEPKNGEASTSMVVLLHGYGSNGDDLIGLVPYLQDALPNTVFVSPNAPESVPMLATGYQWFPLQTLAREERDKGVYYANDIVDQFLDQMMVKYRLSEEQTVLLGFSQGTMMALHVGLRRQRKLAGILGFSGMLAAPGKLKDEIQSRPPVLMVHGEADDVIPIPAMFEAIGALEANNVTVDKHISPHCAHSISEDGLKKGAFFLKKKLVDKE